LHSTTCIACAASRLRRIEDFALAIARPLLIVKTGSTLPSVAKRRGDFEDWIRDGTGFAPSEVRVVAVREGERLPGVSTLSGVIVTGSSAYVSDREDWSESTALWLRSVIASDTPLLGICYGHQLIAHALGGRVDRNPRGREIGTVEVSFESSDDELLGALEGRVQLQATHLESVLELPSQVRRLGSTELDPHSAFSLGERSWGVQFHPEFDADVMRGYLVERAELIRGEGLDPIALRQAARETPAGRALLERFGAIVRESER
jgi:GMP synthase (glutamine-hydrolysing)